MSILLLILLLLLLLHIIIIIFIIVYYYYIIDTILLPPFQLCPSNFPSSDHFTPGSASSHLRRDPVRPALRRSPDALAQAVEVWRAAERLGSRGQRSEMDDLPGDFMGFRCFVLENI